MNYPPIRYEIVLVDAETNESFETLEATHDKQEAKRMKKYWTKEYKDDNEIYVAIEEYSTDDELEPDPD